MKEPKKPVKKIAKKEGVKKKPTPSHLVLEKMKSVIKLIESEGLSLTKACERLKADPSHFNKFLDSHPELIQHYVRAREKRAEKIIEEVIEIADDESEDKVPFYGAVKIKRDQLRIETRLKYLSTMYPKKYGNKIDITSDNEALKPSTIIVQLGNGKAPDETTE